MPFSEFLIFIARVWGHQPGSRVNKLGFMVLRVKNTPGLLDGDSVVRLARHATLRLPGFRPMHQQQVQGRTYFLKGSCRSRGTQTSIRLHACKDSTQSATPPEVDKQNNAAKLPC
ncbi:MAG: hypothetical protein FRX49_12388 [Trebouxia sp. A1-2]|nr:MAG: hypothetical protein FRX49_12388 [Trebouxia sp. A1-2]